jgi:hypothetical protein
MTEETKQAYRQMAEDQLVSPAIWVPKHASVILAPFGVFVQVCHEDHGRLYVRVGASEEVLRALDASEEGDPA